MSQDRDDAAKRILRSEMVKSGLSYDDLAARLAPLGVEATPASLRNKLSRGRFTAEFFLQCLEAMGVKTLRLSD